MKTGLLIILTLFTAVGCSPDKSIKTMNFGPGPEDEDSLKALEAECGSCNRGSN
jgi:uncharacterized protein YcfL